MRKNLHYSWNNLKSIVKCAATLQITPLKLEKKKWKCSLVLLLDVLLGNEHLKKWESQFKLPH